MISAGKGDSAIKPAGSSQQTTGAAGQTGEGQEAGPGAQASALALDEYFGPAADRSEAAPPGASVSVMFFRGDPQRPTVITNGMDALEFAGLLTDDGKVREGGISQYLNFIAAASRLPGGVLTVMLDPALVVAERKHVFDDDADAIPYDFFSARNATARSENGSDPAAIAFLYSAYIADLIANFRRTSYLTDPMFAGPGLASKNVAAFVLIFGALKYEGPEVIAAVKHSVNIPQLKVVLNSLVRALGPDTEKWESAIGQFGVGSRRHFSSWGFKNSQTLLQDHPLFAGEDAASAGAAFAPRPEEGFEETAVPGGQTVFHRFTSAAANDGPGRSMVEVLSADLPTIVEIGQRLAAASGAGILNEHVLSFIAYPLGRAVNYLSGAVVINAYAERRGSPVLLSDMVQLPNETHIKFHFDPRTMMFGLSISAKGNGSLSEMWKWELGEFIRGGEGVVREFSEPVLPTVPAVDLTFRNIALATEPRVEALLVGREEGAERKVAGPPNGIWNAEVGVRANRAGKVTGIIIRLYHARSNNVDTNSNPQFPLPITGQFLRSQSPVTVLEGALKGIGINWAAQSFGSAKIDDQFKGGVQKWLNDIFSGGQMIDWRLSGNAQSPPTPLSALPEYPGLAVANGEGQAAAALPAETTGAGMTLPTVADVLAGDRPGTAFEDVMRSILAYEFGGDKGVMARVARTELKELSRFLDGKMLPASRIEVKLLARRLKLDSQPLLYAWVISKSRLPHETILPRLPAISINNTSARKAAENLLYAAAFLTGNDPSSFAKGPLDISKMAGLAYLAMAEGFEEEEVLEVVSDYIATLPDFAGEKIFNDVANFERNDQPRTATLVYFLAMLYYLKRGDYENAAYLSVETALSLNELKTPSISDALTIQIRVAELLAQAFMFYKKSLASGKRSAEPLMTPQDLRLTMVDAKDMFDALMNSRNGVPHDLSSYRFGRGGSEGVELSHRLKNAVDEKTVPAALADTSESEKKLIINSTTAASSDGVLEGFRREFASGHRALWMRMVSGDSFILESLVRQAWRGTISSGSITYKVFEFHVMLLAAERGYIQNSEAQKMPVDSNGMDVEMQLLIGPAVMPSGAKMAH